MADSFSKEVRSRIMRAVKSRGNKSTEIKLIEFFKENKITGWRRNYKLNGKPDFVFPRKRVAVFADGCFWHGHDCRNLKPKQNFDYWRKKILRNKKRDREISSYLTGQRWNVFRIFECHIKKSKIPPRLLGILKKPPPA